jgi:hypothetical protein
MWRKFPILRQVRAFRFNRSVLFVVMWAAAVVSGICLFDGYELAAARTGPMTQYWPAASALRTAPGVATVIMAIHPKCPCSNLSLSQLQGVLNRRHMRINVHLLVYQPTGYPDDWSMTSVVRRAQRIQGVDVMFDRGGDELKKFQARASGELWFYDGNGKLLFRGGITGGRGHPGKNSGISSLISLADGGAPSVAEAPVFGCAIGEDERIVLIDKGGKTNAQ